MVQVWLEFGAALVFIAVAGARLAHCGDVIGTRTGLGGTWVGLMLIATVTSLPEVVTGISAVALAHEPDIAVGALLGSCVFNLFILALLDAVSRGPSIFERVRHGHARAAAYGALMIAVAAAGIVLEGEGLLPRVGTVGLSSPIVFVLYVICLRSLFRYEKEQFQSLSEPDPLADGAMSLRDAALGFWLAAMVVVAVGLYLPFIGEQIVQVLGVKETFVGSLFVAFATSLPELVVTLAALRIGAVNMAMSNVLGSNLFNVLVIAPEDLFHTSGALLADVSRTQLVSAVSAILMSGVVLLALAHPPRRRFARVLFWSSVPLAGVYVAHAWLLYLGEV